MPCSPLSVVAVALGCVRSLLPHHRALLAVRLVPTLASLAGIEWSMTLGTLAQVLLVFRFRRKTWDLEDTLLVKQQTATLRTPHSH